MHKYPITLCECIIYRSVPVISDTALYSQVFFLVSNGIDIDFQYTHKNTELISIVVIQGIVIFRVLQSDAFISKCNSLDLLFKLKIWTE